PTEDLLEFRRRPRNDPRLKSDPFSHVSRVVAPIPKEILFQRIALQRKRGRGAQHSAGKMTDHSARSIDNRDLNIRLRRDAEADFDLVADVSGDGRLEE